MRVRPAGLISLTLAPEETSVGAVAWGTSRLHGRVLGLARHCGRLLRLLGRFGGAAWRMNR
jgi:hypothetical protein